MAGIAGILQKNLGPGQLDDELTDSIDPLCLCERRVVGFDGGKVAVARKKENENSDSREIVDERFIGFVFGEPIDAEYLVWEQILRYVCGKDSHRLSGLKGTFAIAIVDKFNSSVYLVSDRTSQQPLYYCHYRDSFAFSTDLSTFCRLQRPVAFNELWLYEMMFFNYPIGQTTFVNNVFRMEPATVFTYDYKSNRNTAFFYAKPFKRRKQLIKGKEALEHAFSVFQARIPKYYETKDIIKVALSGGFDSRTVLSLAPEKALSELETYTYGEPGCYDLTEAACFSEKSKIANKKIVLDQAFINRLHDLMYDTVGLSGGLEKITRSILPFVFSKVTDSGKESTRIISGVSGDHLFRDHINGSGNVPSLISKHMMDVFQKREIVIEDKYFKNAFGTKYPEFEAHIRKVIYDLRNRYGELTYPEAYLSYLVYETGPKHFSGESAIANSYGSYVSPYWDSDIMNLAYEVEFGTIGLSEKHNKKDRYRECLLQSFIIGKNRNFRKIPIKGGIPLMAYTCNNKFAYQFFRVFTRGPGKIMEMVKHKPKASLENWESWINEILAENIKILLSRHALVRKFLTEGFLENTLRHKNIHWISKIATAEIVMGLVQNKWKHG